MTDILLATYNGGRFLREQLDSLLTSIADDMRVLISDDGSTDDTPAILSDYAKKHPDTIHLISGPAHEKSAKGNFISLLHASCADYVFFCDQDDVWETAKIQKSLNRIKQEEVRFGAGCPLLLHTDLAVVDAQLAPLSPSFWRYQNIDPTPSLSRLLVQNSVTGCTMLINRPLITLLKKAPASDMLMHDWWAALIAASMGHIVALNESLIRYRQHGGNQLGASGFDPMRDIKKAADGGGGYRQRVLDTMTQAKAFYTAYEGLLPEHAWHVIYRYAHLPMHKKPVRMLMLLGYGYLKKGFLRQLGQLYYI